MNNIPVVQVFHSAACLDDEPPYLGHGKILSFADDIGK